MLPQAPDNTANNECEKLPEEKIPDIEPLNNIMNFFLEGPNILPE